MANTISVGDIIQARHEFTEGSNKAFNIWEYEVQAVTDLSTGLPAAVAVPMAPLAATIGQAIYESYKVPWGTLAVENVQYSNVTIQGTSPAPRSRPYTFTPNDPQEGTRVGDPLPLQDSVTFLKRTAYGERWGMGRMFFVGLSEADQSTGVMTPAWVTLAIAQAQSFMDTILAVDLQYSVQLKPVLFRGEAAPLPRVLPLITVELSDGIIKTQRRRRPGKGI